MTTYLAPEAYLPHRAPMCLIDRVIEVTKEDIVCEVDTHVDGPRAPLLDAGTLAPEYLIEMMAQAIGCWSGYWRAMGDADTASTDDETLAKIGLLLSVRQGKVLVETTPLDETLRVQMTRQLQDGRLAGFTGAVYLEDTPLASAKVTVYQPLESELNDLFG